VNTNYNALNARLQRRFANGVQFDAIYRFSKSLDNLSNEGPGFFTNQTYPVDNSQEYGLSDYDVKHYAVISGLWDLPFFRNGKYMGEQAFRRLANKTGSGRTTRAFRGRRRQEDVFDLLAM
jgi:hypothetical protein